MYKLCKLIAVLSQFTQGWSGCRLHQGFQETAVLKRLALQVRNAVFYSVITLQASHIHHLTLRLS